MEPAPGALAAARVPLASGAPMQALAAPTPAVLARAMVVAWGEPLVLRERGATMVVAKLWVRRPAAVGPPPYEGDPCGTRRSGQLHRHPAGWIRTNRTSASRHLLDG